MKARDIIFIEFEPFPHAVDLKEAALTLVVISALYLSFTGWCETKAMSKVAVVSAPFLLSSPHFRARLGNLDLWLPIFARGSSRLELVVACE